MLEHALNALTGQAAQVLLRANGNRERYAGCEHRAIADAAAGFAGLLAAFSCFQRP